ncbi:permease prefix domain 1-containing protein [Actinoplanes rectilineatus]|uniref:permease prefix domain 1-containing protein n=1 Tax=Actinoplanes rectilineatus TaxID=113571 RepID=UPI0005F2ECE4|nr:permease prefix domain 1-containing protein [Actinoplanes rectilineatus]
MTTLIDRYVYTVLRRVPEQQRTDIERELRASIDDAVEARVGAGDASDAATEQTLLELGDPDRLADGYAERPQYLIGPEFYPTWTRLTRTLLLTVLPIVVTVIVVVGVLEEGATFGSVLGSAIGSALTVAAHMVFWTTGVIWLLERTGSAAGPVLGRRPWTPADLPKYEPGRITAVELVGTLLWPVLVIVGLVLQQFTFTDVPVLDPANWTFWWPYFIGVMILEVGYGIWLFRGQAWNHTVTAVNAAIGVLFAAPLVWLVTTDRFFNPQFLAGLHWGDVDPDRWLTFGTLAATVIGTVWGVIDVALRAERARRGRPGQVPGTAPMI